ncbi:Hypothetical predicted protein [Lecanosticta acicola]|uniref:Uncharacterized protein n=1 Tax=Lecanosticta acicola TaxID=111012 RepID=A0AAI8Z4C8_9PEZI|nr:Hypothetical predicted protein [Lecanosticta acicola]
MATSSPSEFLTFLRAAATSRALQCSSVSRQSARSFASSIPRRQGSASDKKDDIGGPAQNKKHAAEKGSDGEPNVQAYESKKGRENRARGEGGVATEQRDPGKSATKKAKEEFPEAPVTIGFQDERGGKGH